MNRAFLRLFFKLIMGMHIYMWVCAHMGAIPTEALRGHQIHPGTRVNIIISHQIWK